MKKLIFLFLLLCSGVEAQNLKVIQGTPKQFTVNTAVDNMALTVIDSGLTYGDTLKITAVFQSPEDRIRLSVVNQLTRKLDSLIVPGAGQTQTFYINTLGARTFEVEIVNKQSVTDRTTTFRYTIVTQPINPTGSIFFPGIDITLIADTRKTVFTPN